MVPTATAERVSVPDAIETARPSSKSIHLVLMSCSILMLAFCVLGAPPGAMKSAIPLIITVVVLTGPLLLPAAMLNERKSFIRRDAILTLPWTLLIALLIVQAAPTTATFAYPLRDALWRRADELIGFNVPAIIAFIKHYPRVERFLFDVYAFTLHPLILCAILLPALSGRRVAAQRYVLSNAFAFVLALPIMVFLPAVGPWVGWGFQPDHLQALCQTTINSLRHGSLNITQSFGGIVCLPSFHAFWAIVSAQALLGFRYLRYPAIALATLITVSTITTGWHYAVDVIAGILMVAVCTVLSNAVISGRFSFKSFPTD